MLVCWEQVKMFTAPMLQQHLPEFSRNREMARKYVYLNQLHLVTCLSSLFRDSFKIWKWPLYESHKIVISNIFNGVFSVTGNVYGDRVTIRPEGNSMAVRTDSHKRPVHYFSLSRTLWGNAHQAGADPMEDFCGYCLWYLSRQHYIRRNASIRPSQPRRNLYHAYLCYMEAIGYKNPLSIKMFGLALEGILRDCGLSYLKRRTKLKIQTNLDLTGESNTDWLPKCDHSTAV